jgi:hypothetical protein
VRGILNTPARIKSMIAMGGAGLQQVFPDRFKNQEL